MNYGLSKGSKRIDYSKSNRIKEIPGMLRSLADYLRGAIMCDLKVGDLLGHIDPCLCSLGFTWD